MKEFMNINIRKVSIFLLLYICIVGLLWICIDINASIYVKYKVDGAGYIKIYYDNKKSDDYFLDEEHAKMQEIQNTPEEIKSEFDVPLDNLGKFRVDFGGMKKVFIKEVGIKVYGISMKKMKPSDIKNTFNLISQTDMVTEDDYIELDIVNGSVQIGTDQMNIKAVKGHSKSFVCIISLLISSILMIILKFSGIDFEGLKDSISKEKILCGIFLAILLIPSVIVRAVLSNENDLDENRVLSVKPELNAATITTYSQQYENYYNDHIPFKKEFVRLNSYIKYNIFNVSPLDAVIIGKDNWLFYNSKYKNEGDTLADYLGTNYYSQEELEDIKKKLEERQTYLNQRGIEFVVMICPNKSQIYQEYMPDSFRKQRDKSRTDQLVEYLRSTTNLKISYPKEDLLSEKEKEQVYFKWDTHWNQKGAYIGFQNLMDTIQGDYEKIDISNIKFQQSERKTSDLEKMINTTPRGKEYDYFPTNYKNEIQSSLVKEDGNKLYYESTNLNGKNILMFRDSFAIDMIPFISKEYQYCTFIWDQYFDKQVIENEQPEVVVYEFVERLQGGLLSN